MILENHGANQFSDFRLISPRNLVYKWISKVLANGIKRVLHSLISPIQSTFIPSKWIAKNGLLAQDIFHSFAKKQGFGGLMHIKFDI